MARRAFTLVELLVVIGVVALLLSILLPTLSKARQSAQRAACLSNQRQAFTALRLYADNNAGVAPIGFRHTGQFNSMVFSNTTFAVQPANALVLWGRIYDAGVLGKSSGPFLHCPAETNPTFMFDTNENPWPPGPDGDPSKATQSGYGLRPEVKIPDDWATPGFRPPKMDRFTVKHAVVADLTSYAPRVEQRHRTGVNAVFGDGSGAWVPRRAFDAKLALLPAPTMMASPAVDAQALDVWRAIDGTR